MNAVEWLGQVRKLDELINAKLDERQRLIDLATDISPRPMDGMPFDNTGTVSKKIENAVVKLIDLAHEIDKLTDLYIDTKKAVVESLEKLPPKEYGVLHRQYIRYMTQAEIAEDMGYSLQHVWRLKKNGLKILENVIVCYIKK